MGKNAKLYKRATRKEKEKMKIAKNSLGDNKVLEMKMKKLEENRKKKQERMKKNNKATKEEEKDNNDDIMTDGPVSSFRQMQQQRKMTSVEKHEQKYPGLKGRVDYVDLMYKKKTYKPAPGIIN
ncbi:hypothetical protein BCR36DRAFT_352885 [Piromyces finnis]|uniref:Uncharacterized protein n=1 Tax=Piromyces finnis TaxID=1754191 RepID=A0A1Y1V8Z4_9FUNG|nr:hypothetical protein BCR36DRAFT_352885 [Piromyces finnis]|eukprot:ORX50016.1 hypothetical protein BCR36DRAFT_352885 [Piromyces finnis]